MFHHIYFIQPPLCLSWQGSSMEQDCGSFLSSSICLHRRSRRRPQTATLNMSGMILQAPSLRLCSSAFETRRVPASAFLGLCRICCSASHHLPLSCLKKKEKRSGTRWPAFPNSTASSDRGSMRTIFFMSQARNCCYLCVRLSRDVRFRRNTFHCVLGLIGFGSLEVTCCIKQKVTFESRF